MKKINQIKSKNITQENIQKIQQLFPSCITEQNGKKVIDFEALKLEFTDFLAEPTKQKYELTWPGKNEARIEANKRTTQTLLPLKEKSVNFENTENIYIEGDNLEVLKILQESYLGKIKVIYIDPPYNTGKDFIYKDNFKSASEKELIDSGQKDEQGNKYVVNQDSNGRYHSDWLSMMYPRLKLARNLLTDDGVIFISIDDNEYDNLKKVCDEIFGENNFIASIAWECRNPNVDIISKDHEYILVYSKNKKSINPIYKDINKANWYGRKLNIENNVFTDEKGTYRLQNVNTLSKEQAHYTYKFNENELIITEYSEIENLDKNKYVGHKYYSNAPETMRKKIKEGLIVFSKNNKNELVAKEKNYNFSNSAALVSVIKRTEFKYSEGKKTIQKLFEGQVVFDFTKPVELIEFFLKASIKNGIILDFFSGSATTAHAAMKYNAENGLKNKYIMVQLEEKIERKKDKDGNYKDNPAYDFCLENNLEPIIPSIAQERIKRAAAKIKEETKANIDYGFRVFKLSESVLENNNNFPENIEQNNLGLFANKYRKNVSKFDIVFSLVLDNGLTLDSKIEEISKDLFTVENGLMTICLVDQFTEETLQKILELNSDLIIIDEEGFSNDSELQNVINKIEKTNPNAKLKVI